MEGVASRRTARAGAGSVKGGRIQAEGKRKVAEPGGGRVPERWAKGTEAANRGERNGVSSARGRGRSGFGSAKREAATVQTHVRRSLPRAGSRPSLRPVKTEERAMWAESASPGRYERGPPVGGRPRAAGRFARPRPPNSQMQVGPRISGAAVAALPAAPPPPTTSTSFNPAPCRPPRPSRPPPTRPAG